ncbi:uncharacterized protein LAESUDRAFT_729521 [Laetiporus sulphureus 93-53]|uniref:Uncharacterized protein n=1 Tax=Laetiporus sulphureus 93-53 TaxID=1314785 RepID=A0A165CLC7_9APHY|nr:uncharacterized protein LAESUDRAFT_729521 [Laetiporus sulphureus 93-53]KZT03015.1 hypothetical protein LAESUDRAFT_729521 [Laetiporus sulphureus 93-53]
MSRQEDGEKIPSLEELSALDLINMLSSKLEQSDACQRARQLRHLEALIKAAETAAAQAERRDLTARVPINRLPTEVLQEIFLTSCTVKLAEYRSKHYQCNNIMTLWNPTWIDRGRAVSLMLVCHHWKEIALEIQELWNGIETYQKPEDHILPARPAQGAGLPRMGSHLSTCCCARSPKYGAFISNSRVVLDRPYISRQQKLSRGASTLAQVSRIAWVPG